MRIRSKCDVPGEGIYLSESGQNPERPFAPLAGQLRSNPVRPVKDIQVHVPDGKADDVTITFIGSWRTGGRIGDKAPCSGSRNSFIMTTACIPELRRRTFFYPNAKAAAWITRRTADVLFPPDDAEQHGWKLEDSLHGQLVEVWHVVYPLVIIRNKSRQRAL